MNIAKLPELVNRPPYSEATAARVAEDTRSCSPSTFGSDRLPDQIAFDRGPCVAPSAMEASKSKRRRFLTRFCGVAPKISGAAAAMKSPSQRGGVDPG